MAVLCKSRALPSLSVSAPFYLHSHLFLPLKSPLSLVPPSLNCPRLPPTPTPIVPGELPEALSGKGGRGHGNFSSCHLSHGRTSSKPRSATHMVLIPRTDKAWTRGRGRAADPSAEVLGLHHQRHGPGYSNAESRSYWEGKSRKRESRLSQGWRLEKTLNPSSQASKKANEVGYQGLLGRQTRTTRGSCPGKCPDC